MLPFFVRILTIISSKRFLSLPRNFTFEEVLQKFQLIKDSWNLN